MKKLFDLHTHTVASGHAFSSIRENAKAAANKGLYALGMSDHSDALSDGASFHYFLSSTRVVPKEMYGVRILKGAEVNIMNTNGDVDLPHFVLDQLDYAIASLHTPCFAPNTVEKNTAAVLGAMQNPLIRIMGHLDDSRYPLDYEKVAAEAARTHVIIEVNNSSLLPNSSRKEGRKNYEELLYHCSFYEIPIVLNSDAHIHFDIGNLETAEKLVQELNYDEELIMNYTKQGLRRILQDRSKYI